MKVRKYRRKAGVYMRPNRKHFYQWIRQRAKHLKVGTIIETCGCDVARVTVCDPQGDDLEYESLTRGGRGSCSIYNCAPIPLRPVAIQKRLALYAQGGKDALVRRYYIEDCKMSPEDADKTMNEWK